MTKFLKISSLLACSSVLLTAPSAASAEAPVALPGTAASGQTLAAFEPADQNTAVVTNGGSTAAPRVKPQPGTLAEFTPLRISKAVPSSGVVTLGKLVPQGSGSVPAATSQQTTNDSAENGECAGDSDDGSQTACVWPDAAIDNSFEGSIVSLRSADSTAGVNSVTAGNALVLRTNGLSDAAPTTVSSDGTIKVTVPDPGTAKTVEVTLGTTGVGAGTNEPAFANRGVTLRDPKVSILQGTQMGNNVQNPGAADYVEPACKFDELSAPTSDSVATSSGYVIREIARDETSCTELVETGIAPGTPGWIETRSTTGSRTLTAYGRYEDFVNIDLAAVKTRLSWSWNTKTNAVTSYSASDSRSHFVPTAWSDWYNHHLSAFRNRSEAYAGTYAQFSGARGLCHNVPVRVVFYANYVSGRVRGNYKAGSPHAGINPPSCFKLMHFSFNVLK